MPDDDLPDPDGNGIYQRYLETCRRLNLEPVSRERAGELVAEWNEAIRSALTPTPTTKH